MTIETWVFKLIFNLTVRARKETLRHTEMLTGSRVRAIKSEYRQWYNNLASHQIDISICHVKEFSNRKFFEIFSFDIIMILITFSRKFLRKREKNLILSSIHYHPDLASTSTFITIPIFDKKPKQLFWHAQEAKFSRAQAHTEKEKKSKKSHF